MAVKKTIERDLQRQVQMMLGTMMGQDKVIVSVTTDIDFNLKTGKRILYRLSTRKVWKVSHLVSNELLNHLQEMVQSLVVLQKEKTLQITGQALWKEHISNGDYERIEETVNNEVNRIRKEIVESPYKIRDIGIQVMVEPPDADDATSMPPGLQEDIRTIYLKQLFVHLLIKKLLEH